MSGCPVKQRIFLLFQSSHSTLSPAPLISVTPHSPPPSIAWLLSSTYHRIGDVGDSQEEETEDTQDDHHLLLLHLQPYLIRCSDRFRYSPRTVASPAANHGDCCDPLNAESRTQRLDRDDCDAMSLHGLPHTQTHISNWGGQESERG